MGKLQPATGSVGWLVDDKGVMMVVFTYTVRFFFHLVVVSTANVAYCLF